MSLLKKLLARINAPGKTERAFINRAPRLANSLLQDLRFQLDDGTALAIANLSRVGLALQKGPLKAWPELHTVITGRLTLNQQSFSIKIQLLNTRDSVAGFRFHMPEPMFSTALEDHFRHEFSAAQMTAIDPKTLKAEPEGEPQWFRGADTSELYIVHRNSDVLKFVLSFLEFRIEYNAPTPPSVFRRTDKGSAKKAYDETSYTLTPITPELRSQTLRFLSGIESLSKEHLQSIIRILSQQ